MTLTEHFTAKDVAGAQAAYDLLRHEYEAVVAEPLTSQRVVRQAQLRADLEKAAQLLEETKAHYAELAAREAEQRRTKALEALRVTESELAQVAHQAEETMAALAPTLTAVIELSKRRYSLRAEVSGSAPRTLLAGPAVVGWLQHRLSGLGAYELGRAQHHHRGPLAELLTVDTAPATTQPDNGNDEDKEVSS